MNPRFRTFYKCKKLKLIREAKVTKGEAEKLLIDQWIAMSQQEKLKYDPKKEHFQETDDPEILTTENDSGSSRKPLSKNNEEYLNSDFSTPNNSVQETTNKFVNVGSGMLCLPSHLTGKINLNTAEKQNNPHSFMQSQLVGSTQESDHTEGICSFIKQQHTHMADFNQPENFKKFEIPVSFTDFANSEDEDDQIQIFTPEFLQYNKKKEQQLKNASKTAGKLSSINNIMLQNEKSSEKRLKEQRCLIQTNKEKLNDLRSKSNDTEASFVKSFTNLKLPTKPDLKIEENSLEYLNELTKILQGNDYNSFKAKVFKKLSK